MKFGIAVALLALASSLTIMNANQKPVGYSEELKQIARDVNSQNLTWEATENHPWVGMTKEQVSDLMSAKFEEDDNVPILSYGTDELASLPKNHDLREVHPECKSLKEVRDQTSCGSCWAVSTASAFTDRICMKHKGKVSPRISARDLMSCCRWCGNGCSGGSSAKAWRYFVKTGVVTGDKWGGKKFCQSYPFPPCGVNSPKGRRIRCRNGLRAPRCKRKCTNKKYRKSYRNDKFFCDTNYRLRSARDAAKDLIKNGPFSVHLEMWGDFMTYKRGVYQKSRRPGRNSGLHAVKVIGYGVESGVKYWLLTNSWNVSWGDKGFFKVRRGTNEIKIERAMNAGTIRKVRL